MRLVSLMRVGGRWCHEFDEFDEFDEGGWVGGWVAGGAMRLMRCHEGAWADTVETRVERTTSKGKDGKQAHWGMCSAGIEPAPEPLRFSPVAHASHSPTNSQSAPAVPGLSPGGGPTPHTEKYQGLYQELCQELNQELNQE